MDRVTKPKRPSPAQFEALRRLYAMGGEADYAEWRGGTAPGRLREIKPRMVQLIYMRGWLNIDGDAESTRVSLTDTGKAVVLRGDYVGLRGRKGT